MQYRFLVGYRLDNRQECLDVITDSPDLTLEEATKRVRESLKPYDITDVADVTVTKAEKSENLNTDPDTSASE